MKPSYSIICFFLTTLAFAQNPRTEDVGDFTEVKVFDLMQVNLIKSDENKVILSGEDVDDIELINKNGELKIRMELDKIFNGNKTFVQVYYKELWTIDGNEGARITTNELLEQDRIDIKVQEGAVVKAGLKVNHAEVRAVTGGIVELSGSAKGQNIEINTGGVYSGERLNTEKTFIRIQAGGEADISATVKAEVKIRAGGDVRVFGNPKQLVKSKVIGGSIKVMD